MEVHIVQKGDTLWKISRQYGVSFDELKKVNAHLANPDYIVPGMKIFLPAKVKKTAPIKKETKPPKMKEPIPLPPTVTEEITEEVPKPMPPPTLPPPIPPIPMLPPEEQLMPFPIESPMPPESPVMMPQPYPVPMPMPMPGVPQYTQPFGCIPCGWMPIYDADCYPYMYGGTHHQAPSYATQIPMPPIPMYDMEEALPVELQDEIEEMPMQMPRPEGWKMIESPEFMDEDFTLPDEETPFIPESIAPPLQPYYESPDMYQGYPQQPMYESAMPIYGSYCNCGSTYPMAAPAYTQNLCASCHRPMHLNPYYQMNYPMYCSICHGYH